MYATLADIEEQVDAAVLVSLTDDSQADAVDEAVVERAIANAGALVDAHCGGRYSVPFDPVPELIRMYAVDLAAFNLYSRRTHVDMPKVIADRQKQALDYLRLIQKGEASAGVPENTVPGAESQSALVSGDERIFSRSKMRGL